MSLKQRHGALRASARVLKESSSKIISVSKCRGDFGHPASSVCPPSQELFCSFVVHRWWLKLHIDFIKPLRAFCHHSVTQELKGVKDVQINHQKASDVKMKLWLLTQMTREIIFGWCANVTTLQTSVPTSFSTCRIHNFTL